MRKELRNRLRRIEGQARGVQRMADQGRSCQEILHQLLAIRSAAHQASLILVEKHALECLRHPDLSMSPEEIVNDVIGVLAKMPY
ncbi:MAG: metal-sensitive transcriptional regulator [Anaerolineae bacterium]